MQHNQSRLLAGMALLLAALTSLLVFFDPPPPAPEPGERDAAPLFAGLATADVEGLVLEEAGRVVAAKRASDGWRLVQPMEATADEAELEGLVSGLALLEVGEAMALEESPDAMGLGRGDGVTVTLQGREGTEHAFTVGSDVPVGAGTYIRDDDGAVRVARTRVADLARPGIERLRAKEVVRFPASAVDRIRVRGEARSLTLAREDGDWWVEEITHPDESAGPVSLGRHRADAARISDALRAMQDLRIDAFPEGPIAMAKEELRIELDGDGGPWAFALGTGADNGPLARGPGTGGPAPVDFTELEGFFAEPDAAWRSRRILPVRPVSVNELDIRFGDTAVAAHTEALDWSDARAVGILRVLADARVSRDDGVPGAEGPPWGEISLGRQDGEALRVDVFQPHGDGRVAQDRAGGPGFVIPDSAISELLGAMANP